MEDRLYSSLSRHGLASSYSVLDGVPFKIGPSFLQSQRVVAPPDLYGPYASTVRSDQYSFETEEAVLAWAQAREEALKLAAEQRAVRQQAEELAKQKASEAESESDEDNITISTSQAKNENIYDVPRSTLAQENHTSHQQKPPVPRKPLSKPLTEPGAILKPTPIHPTGSTSLAKRSEDSATSKGFDSSARIDVSMFESEADPFDNLELQTLNDMEELKVLLDSSTSKPTPASITAQSNINQSHSYSPGPDFSGAPQPGDPDAGESFYEMATVVKDSAWETFDDDDSPQETVTKNRDNIPSPAISESSTGEKMDNMSEDGEYVEISSDCKKQSVTMSIKNRGINGVSKGSNLTNWTQTNTPGPVLGGKLPTSLANSKLYKPVLPPITKTGTATNNDSNSPFIAPQSTNPFTQKSLQEAKNPFLQNNEHLNLFSLTSESNPQSQNVSGAVTTISKPLPLPPPPVSSKPSMRKHQSDSSSRMWSSLGPSLTASFDESNSNIEKFTHNPYSRHSLSTTDLHSSSNSPDFEDGKPSVLNMSTPPTNTSQPWNRLRPLPRPPSFPATGSYKASQLPPSQPTGLTDPYHSLSHELQAFTDSLTSMGFLRARVARAVAKFGQDEKEVLDHLIAVDTLVEKKYAPVAVESTLQIYKNDLEKAEKFLQMFAQFAELGFKSDKIQEALVTTNMDHDKALDMLTA